MCESSEFSVRQLVRLSTGVMACSDPIHCTQLSAVSLALDPGDGSVVVLGVSAAPISRLQPIRWAVNLVEVDAVRWYPVTYATGSNRASTTSRPSSSS